jgi:hypothetical protein
VIALLSLCLFIATPWPDGLPSPCAAGPSLRSVSKTFVVRVTICSAIENVEDIDEIFRVANFWICSAIAVFVKIYF